jgi:hypothetical protein
MKKFTALMLVAICLIVGGVYASWSYATGNITTYFTETVDPTIDAVTEATPIGEIEVVSNTLAIAVGDRYDGTTYVGDTANKPGDYIAEVYYTGSLVVTFTPGAGADTQILNNGLPMEMLIEVVEATYGENVIFAAVSSVTSAFGTYTKNDDGSWTWTITGEQFGSKLTFNGGKDLKLATLDEYNNFSKEFDKVKFTLKIGQEGQVATGTPAQNG